MARAQDFAPFAGQVRNQYEVWLQRVNGDWKPVAYTFNELDDAEEIHSAWIDRGFNARLVTVQYTIIDVQ